MPSLEREAGLPSRSLLDFSSEFYIIKDSFLETVTFASVAVVAKLKISSDKLLRVPIFCCSLLQYATKGELSFHFSSDFSLQLFDSFVGRSRIVTNEQAFVRIR